MKKKKKREWREPLVLWLLVIAAGITAWSCSLNPEPLSAKPIAWFIFKLGMNALMAVVLLGALSEWFLKTPVTAIAVTLFLLWIDWHYGLWPFGS